MAIEIFGFAIKPEISIGDIAAIAALISSALIFWFGYVRTRKSEQIKIARELADRIEANGKKVGAFKVHQQSSPEEDNRTREIIFDIRDLLHEVKYFHYLIQTHEIKNESILWHYIPRIGYWLDIAGKVLSHIAPGTTVQQRSTVVPDDIVHDLARHQTETLNKVKNWLKPLFDKYPPE